jgi:Sulfotransferase domain
MPAKRLVMIMGFQRSGTTALFDTLASAPGVSARHEHADDDLYDDYFLRPEPQIRSVLAALPGTVLLKPVRESRRRSPLEVAKEYHDYDLTMIWLYRDPVNVYQSWLEKQWVTNPEGIGQHWVSRNKKCLASRAALGDTLLIVRYEDLVASPASVAALAERLGLVVESTLRADSNAGRARVAAVDQQAIDAASRATLEQLDDARSIWPPA